MMLWQSNWEQEQNKQLKLHWRTKHACDALAALFEARLADAQANLKEGGRQNEQLINEPNTLMQWGYDW